MEMGMLCSEDVRLETKFFPVVQSLAALLAHRHLLCLLLVIGSLVGDIDVLPDARGDQRFPLAHLNKVREPVAENKDAGETDHTNEEDDNGNNQTDDEDDDDMSGEEESGDDEDSDDDADTSDDEGSDDDDDDDSDDENDEDSDSDSDSDSEEEDEDEYCEEGLHTRGHIFTRVR